MRTYLTLALLLLALLVALCRSAGAQERPSPAQAAAVLARCTACEANVANRPAPLPEGPAWVVAGSQPGAPSWLTFPAGPRYRLDGLPLWLPPAMYGSPFWYPGPRFGGFSGGEGTVHGGGSGHKPGGRR